MRNFSFHFDLISLIEWNILDLYFSRFFLLWLESICLGSPKIRKIDIEQTQKKNIPSLFMTIFRIQVNSFIRTIAPSNASLFVNTKYEIVFFFCLLYVCMAVRCALIWQFNWSKADNLERLQIRFFFGSWQIYGCQGLLFLIPLQCFDTFRRNPGQNIIVKRNVADGLYW